MLIENIPFFKIVIVLNFYDNSCFTVEMTMKIAVYGAGYVGLVSSVCFAKLGHEVICVDINEERVNMLSRGESPIYEENLTGLLQEQLACARLSFTENIAKASRNAEVHIIATGTPGLDDGNADLSQVFSVVAALAEHTESSGLIVTKSTVPVGTGDEIEAFVISQLALGKKTHTLEVASNPEFLREGSAVSDFLNADRIIVGGNDEAIQILKNLYQPLIDKGVNFSGMSRRSAELTKYSANAMLACKISFINQISQLAEKLNANIDDVRHGIGLDNRIGPHFLLPGIGYGGSCFPKDVRALIQIAHSNGVDSRFLEAIDAVNETQKNWVFSKLNKHFNQELSGLKIGLWGLAFKPGTDDMREASSVVAINALIQAGVKMLVYDPAANKAARKLYKDSGEITWCNSAEAVLDANLDALVIATEWPEFRNFSLTKLRDSLGTAALFDGRNCFELNAIQEAQFACYYSIGRPVVMKDPVN